MKILSVQFLCPVRICIESDSGETTYYNGNIDLVNQSVEGVSPEIAKQVISFVVQSPSLEIPDASSKFKAIKDGLGSRVQSFVKDVDAQPQFKSSKHTSSNAEAERD